MFSLHEHKCLFDYVNIMQLLQLYGLIEENFLVP